MSREGVEEFFSMIVETKVLKRGKRVIIDDVGNPAIRAVWEAQLSALVFDSEQLSRKLTNETLVEMLQSDRTLTLIIGASGADAWRQIAHFTTHTKWEVPVHAKTWERGEQTQVTTSGIDWPFYVDPYITDIVAVDDVISTGKTLTLIRERNACRFPCAKWHALVWLTRKEKLSGFTSITAACCIKCEEGGIKPPINSLSTLLADKELSEAYAKKHQVNIA